MTSDNSTRDTVSAKCAFGTSNCNDLGETVASSENAIIEQVARLAQRYAARAPTAAEFKAFKPEIILGTADRDKPINFRRENLARPMSILSSQNPWVALQAHVEGSAKSATKARSRAKRYIPMIATLGFFMYFVGPVYLDEAYAPLFSGKMYPMVGPATNIVPTNANGEPKASGGTGQVAYRQGCETGWNVIPPEQHCVNDPLWEQPKELFGGYRFFDSSTAFSAISDQFLASWTHVRVSQDGDRRIPGNTAHQSDREETAEASDTPRFSTLSGSGGERLPPGTAPSTVPTEHPTVEQQNETLTRSGDERLTTRANLVPLPQARPKTIDNWQR
jgi:hypothetical protein